MSGEGDSKAMTVIVFSGDLDKVLAAFILATTGAAAGFKVTMFFTFWGLNVIKKNEGAAGGRGLMQKMLNLLNRGGSKRLPLSKFHMLGLGTWMMKKLMKETRTPEVEEMIKTAKKLGVKFVACTTSIGVMGLTKEDFREEVDSFAGASTYLNDARKGHVNLFI